MKLNCGRIIGVDREPYFISELNTSHFGSVDTARQMIDAAHEIGCDCVKFQSWSVSSLYSETYYRRNPVARRFVDKFAFSPENLKELSNYARSRGIAFASTPYSREEVDFLLHECNVPFVKIASMEINNYSYLEYIAKTGSAIVLSTGMSDEQEIQRAVDCIRSAGNDSLCVLHCVSVYPADVSIINLNNIKMLQRLFPDLSIGFSDHTLGQSTAIAAVALGAPIIEKHFTLDSKRIGMDNQMAMEPNEFGELIAACRDAWRSLGSERRVLTEVEQEQRISMRRSIVSKRYIREGAIISIEDVDFKRPGDGFNPSEIGSVVGTTAAKNIPADEVIYPSMLNG